MKTTKFFNKFLAAAALVGVVAVGCSSSDDGEENPVTYSIAVTNDGNGSAEARIADKTVTEAQADATVTLSAAPKDGFVFSKWTVVSGGIEPADVNAASTTFKMPAGNVSVKAEFVVATYAITVTDDGNGTAVAKMGEAEVAAAAEGSAITVEATPKEGYAFSKWVVEGATVSDANAPTATFTMPAAAVTVKAEFAATYAVTLTDDGNGSAAARVGNVEVSAAVAGATVSITAVGKEGFIFDAWVVKTGGAALADLSASTTTFEMPANAVSIEATFVPGPSVTYNNDADLWANTATLTLADIPADAASVKVSYKRSADTDWQDATVEGNKASIAPAWSAGKNEAQLDIYTPDTNTGVFAGNTYQFQLVIDGEVVDSGQFIAASGDAIPNGDMSGWSKKIMTMGEDFEITYPNASGQTFWDSGNNMFLENPSTQVFTPLCEQGSGDDAGTARLSGQTIFGSILAPGNMYTGNFNYSGFSGTASFGQPYGWSARPTALKLRYKATIGLITVVGANDPEKESLKDKDVPDRSRVFVAITDWTSQHGVTSGMVAPSGIWDPAVEKSFDEGPVLAYGDLVITDSVDDWQTVTIPIVWYDKDAPVPSADKYSLVISCATSYRGDYMTGCHTNVMYVDDFEWVY